MPAPGPTAPWFLEPPQAAGRVRLICCAHAGGSALGFIAWRPLLDPAIALAAVQLPGRGARSAEPAGSDFATLVAQLATQIGRRTDLPCVLFGHSMGALLAFEVARACATAGHPPPRALVLSGCAGPRQARRAGLGRLPDAALEQTLGRLHGGATGADRLQVFLRRGLPAVRADLALMETYRYRAGAPLALPITLVYGRADPLVSAAALAPWAQETRAACTLHAIDGGHFPTPASRAALVALVQRAALPWAVQAS